MGVRMFKLSGGDSWKTDPRDPIPSRFVIDEIEQVGMYVIATITYPNCTNFEGRKLVVFRDATVQEIKQLNTIDPHFYEDSKIIARFAPTHDGYKMALKACGTM